MSLPTYLKVLAFFLQGIFSKIVIYEPESLRNLFKDSNHIIKHVNANYGHIPYGQTIIGGLHFNKTNELGCDKNHIFT